MPADTNPPAAAAGGLNADAARDDRTVRAGPARPRRSREKAMSMGVSRVRRSPLPASPSSGSQSGPGRRPGPVGGGARRRPVAGAAALCGGVPLAAAPCCDVGL